jgi:DNA-binding HxlR family transcriptional regulator
LILEALAAGSMTTPQIATATGYARSTLSTRMVDLERDGLVRRIGFEVVHAKTSARTVRWALKEAAK